MDEDEVQKKINDLLDSEFFHHRQESTDFSKLLDSFMEKIQDFFGYNDGEPLDDEEKIQFVVDLFKYKMMQSHGVYEEK